MAYGHTSAPGLGPYGRYSGRRADRMAAVVAASVDRRDVVCVPEADEAAGLGYYGSQHVLSAAVRVGLMSKTGLPKEFRGREYRTTYVATEDGVAWLDGYRRHAESRALLESCRGVGSAPRRRRLPRKRIPMSEAVARREAELSESLSRAVREMRARLREREAERRARERSGRPSKNHHSTKESPKTT